MNKEQHAVEKAKLQRERIILNALKKQYKQAAEDIQGKINIHNNKIDFILNEYDTLDDDMKSILQAQIYQQKYQKQLKAQVDAIIEAMNDNQYDTIQEYLDDCYNIGYIGTAYDLHGQGIPLIAPIDQKAMLDAVTLNPKLSAKLYGTYMTEMKRHVIGEISRGIATADSFEHIARNISNATNMSFNKTMRIVRTEGHGIQIRAAVDMQEQAKKAGADVVKQWDATLDKNTRDSHARLDGEIRELDEKFSNGMKYPSDPSGGAAEVINCRCALLQRAKWALDDEELDILKQRAEHFGLDKTDNFNDFQNKFLKGAEEVKTMPDGFVPAKTIEEAQAVAKELGVKYAVYDDLPLETVNLLNEALLTLPEDARPTFAGSSKMLEFYRDGKLPRSSKNYYGVSIYTDYFHIGVGEYDDIDGMMVGISSYYKSAGKITKAKKQAQEAYMKKHGNKWFFNEDGAATPFHEMGHVYAEKYGLPEGFEEAAERWWKESGCDMLQKPSEAWAEAWGAYHTKNPDLPDYISKYIEKSTKKTVANIPKSSKIVSKDTYDKLPDGTAKMYAKQTEKELLKGMRKEQKKIDLHLDKIAHPEKYVDDWENRNEQYKKGIIEKWKKDIRNHRLQVELRKEELARRKE